VKEFNFGDNHIVVAEESYNEDAGVELHYKLTHNPLESTVVGCIRINEEEVQRFSDKEGIIEFFSNAWSRDDRKCTKAIEGRVGQNEIVLFWNGHCEVDTTSITVNYKVKEANA
jgi:hypothetical protein